MNSRKLIKDRYVYDEKNECIIDIFNDELVNLFADDDDMNGNTIVNWLNTLHKEKLELKMDNKQLEMFVVERIGRQGLFELLGLKGV